MVALTVLGDAPAPSGPFLPPRATPEPGRWCGPPPPADAASRPATQPLDRVRECPLDLGLQFIARLRLPGRPGRLNRSSVTSSGRPDDLAQLAEQLDRWPWPGTPARWRWRTGRWGPPPCAGCRSGPAPCPGGEVLEPGIGQRPHRRVEQAQVDHVALAVLAARPSRAAQMADGGVATPSGCRPATGGDASGSPSMGPVIDIIPDSACSTGSSPGRCDIVPCCAVGRHRHVDQAGGRPPAA